MNEFIQRYVARIESASLRERLLIFLALALGLVLVANSAVLGPLRAKQKRLAAEVAAQQGQTQALQSQLQRLLQGSAADPDAANRARVAAQREELRQLSLRIVEEQRRFTPPEQMQRVLEEMLEKNRGLMLVDLKTLPSAPITGAQEPGGATGMYRHGVELTLQGSYAELYEYLRSLEGLPNQLYWARAELSVVEHPLLRLKLTVHTLSFDRAWLIV